MNYDKDLIDFNDSLDFEKNKQAILKSTGTAEGGCSGEFFYFTYDNKLILKSMKKEEVEVFIPNIDKFI